MLNMVTLDRLSVYSLSRWVHTLLTRPHLSLVLNTPPQAQVRSVSDGIQGPLRLASIRIDIAESVFQLALCVVAKSVLRLASFLRDFSSRLFVDLLRALSSRLRCAVAESTRYCVVSLVLPLKLGKSGIVNPRVIMIGKPFGMSFG